MRIFQSVLLVKLSLELERKLKNLNSFRSLERAINFEIQRQIQVVEAGGTIVQQTMNFDDVSGETSALRSKENAHDYRYFPDPDLKPLIVTQEQIDAVKHTMPDLPAVVKARLQADYQLPDHDVKVLLQERHLFDYILINSCQQLITRIQKQSQSGLLVILVH